MRNGSIGFSAVRVDDLWAVGRITAAVRPMKDHLVGSVAGTLWVLMGVIGRRQPELLLLLN